VSRSDDLAGSSLFAGRFDPDVDSLRRSAAYGTAGSIGRGQENGTSENQAPCFCSIMGKTRLGANRFSAGCAAFDAILSRNASALKA